MFANRVRESRKKMGKTQQEIADFVGISRTYLSMIENGKANMTFALRVKLAQMLGISPGYDEVVPENTAELLCDKNTIFLELVKAKALFKFYENWTSKLGLDYVLATAFVVPESALPDTIGALDIWADELVGYAVDEYPRPEWFDERWNEKHKA